MTAFIYPTIFTAILDQAMSPADEVECAVPDARGA
jgi:hypothetical protein